MSRASARLEAGRAMLQISPVAVVERSAGTGRASVPVSASLTVIARTHSAYQPSKRFDLVAGLGSAFVVAALLSGFVWMRVAPAIRDRHDLMVLDLHVAPPTPAHIVPRPHPKAEPQKVRPIMAPPAIVRTEAPSPVVVAPALHPVTPAISAPPAPAAAPVVAAAPPAPLVPAEGGDLSSKMISAKPPSYPLDSRRKKEEGTVILTVLLNLEGGVSAIAVAQSSGSERLDRAAVSAVRGWRWSPILKNGVPVAVQGHVKIPFVLRR